MPFIVDRTNRRQFVTLVDVPESTTDSYGQPSQSAVEIGTYHASVKQFDFKGHERLVGRQVWATATHFVEMDWIGSDITPSSRNPAGLILPTMKLLLKKDGVTIRVLSILTANDVEELHQTWQLICSEHPGATS